MCRPPPNAKSFTNCCRPTLAPYGGVYFLCFAKSVILFTTEAFIFWTLRGVPPPKPSCCPGWAEGHARPPLGDHPCAQARMIRTAREHEIIMARKMMSNHTDIQNKYCGHSNDIHRTQRQHTKVVAVGRHHKRGATALRPRHLFCGLLCTGFEYGECRCCHHNTCLACRCDWTACSVPL